MERIWKRFEDWVTASRRNVFWWARLKLTSVYIAILAVILAVFSIALYESLSQELLETREQALSDDYYRYAMVETLETMRDDIILIDILILLISSFISYILAGYTLRPIQRSLEAQREFSENASHELRTPLAVIKNDIEVLLRNPNPLKEHVHRTLESSIEEIDHITMLAEDLLAIARSENSRTDPVRMDMSLVVEDTVAKMRPIAERKGIELKSSVEGALHIIGREASIARVCMNVLQNSIQHTPAGGTIIVQLKHAERAHVLTVTDTGTGISEKDLPYVFERFYKGPSATGSGLGLAIVKELVEEHGGTVELSSREGRGTSVSIRIPAA